MDHKKLGVLTSKIGSGATPRGGGEAYKAAGISLIRSLNIYDDGFRPAKLARIDDQQADNLSNVVVEPNDVLLNITGASIARCCLAPEAFLPARVNQHVSILRPIKGKLAPAFLHYLLISKAYKDRLLQTGEDGGSTRQAITKAQLQEFSIEYPQSLNEQQRIVELLDEAFAGIATAKANAEKNLQNAHALFESHLQSIFAHRGKGWGETTLEKVLANQPQNGWSPPAANHSDVGTPVLTLSSVTGFHFRPRKIKFTSAPVHPQRNYWVQNGDLLITRSNTPELVGHVAIAAGIIEPTIYPDLIMRMNTMPDCMMTEFLYYQLRSPALRKEITGRAQGANPTMKKISNGAVKTLPIAVPPIADQKEIVETLNALASETQRLAAIYERKIAALEELKKSLLHLAFTGQLTANWHPSNLIGFPAALPGISSLDLHAGLVAITHLYHVEQGTEKYYGHVKMEKSSHMYEAHHGLELERNPYQDAAGPNDMARLLEMEEHARKKRYFDIEGTEGKGYKLKPLSGYTDLIKRTRKALGDKLPEVEEFLRLTHRMNKHAIEVLATLYAAWNNLLLDQEEITDERIVCEARDNWHEDKLLIKREVFVDMLATMRKNGLVPTGRGKRVVAKA